MFKPLRYLPHMLLMTITAVCMVEPAFPVRAADGANELDPKYWLEKAKVTVGGLSQAGVKQHAYRVLVELQVEANDLAGARQMLAAIYATAQDTTDARAKADTFYWIGLRQIRVGDLATARQTLAIASTKAFDIPDTQNKDLKYLLCASIAGGQADADDFNGAKTTARRIGDERNKALAYDYIAESQNKKKDFSGAIESLTLAKTEASKITILWAKTQRYTSIAIKQAKATEAPAARKTLETVRAFVQDASIEDKEQAYIEIAKAQAEIGDTTEALATAIDIPGEQHRSAAYIVIANAQINQGNLAGAVQTLLTAKRVVDSAKDVSLNLRDDGKYNISSKPQPWTESSYERIAQTQVKAGDISGAKATADERLTYQGPRVFTDIAEAQIKIKDLPSARSMLAKAKAAADVLEDSFLTSKTQEYAVIAFSQVKAGDLAGAQQISGTLKTMAATSGTPKDYIVAGAVQGLLFEVGAVEAWTESISDQQCKCAAYLGVANGLLAKNAENRRYPRTW